MNSPRLLSKAATGGRQLWDWLQQEAEEEAGPGLHSSTFKQGIRIHQDTLTLKLESTMCGRETKPDRTHLRSRRSLDSSMSPC